MSDLMKFLSSPDGSTPWYVVGGGIIAGIIGILPLILALWKGFHKNYDGEVAVKYKNGKPVQRRFGKHKGLTLLRGAGIRFALYGFGEWRKMSYAEQATKTVTRDVDLSDGTQIAITMSFKYALLSQLLDMYYPPNDIAVVRYLRASQGELESILLETYAARVVDIVRSNGLTLAHITPTGMYDRLSAQANAELYEKGVWLKAVNLTAAKTPMQKICERGFGEAGIVPIFQPSTN